MNRKEYLESNNKTYAYYVKVQQLLKDWKAENNINETCVVHHRDDTEECIKYNNEHYELWSIYKQNNGQLSYPEFRSNLAKNNIPNMYLTRNTND